MGRWGEQTVVAHEGTEDDCARHLCLGNGGPTTCARIHFCELPDGRFLVANVGRHLQHTTS
jgi:hypothetical protein